MSPASRSPIIYASSALVEAHIVALKIKEELAVGGRQEIAEDYLEKMRKRNSRILL